MSYDWYILVICLSCLFFFSYHGHIFGICLSYLIHEVIYSVCTWYIYSILLLLLFLTLQGPTGRLVPQDRRWARCSSAAHHGICRSGLQHNFPDTQLGRPAWSTLANVYLHGPGSGVGSCKRAAFLTGDTDKTVCLTGSRHHEDSDQCNN